VDYYKKQHGVNIRDLNQPMLLSKKDKFDKEEVWLVPELCEMTGLTDSMRADFNLMRDMSKYLHKSPAESKVQIEKVIKQLIEQQQSHSKFSIQSQPLEIKG
jgi:hypothetical protein